MKRCLLILVLVLVLGMEAVCCGQALSYTTPIQAGVHLYQSPGFAGGSIGSVNEDGVYTIVEEALCIQGFLWGRLKSGAGWVMLGQGVSAGNYTVKLGGWVPICEGPGDDYPCCGTIGEDGVFTIVDEIDDGEGCIWGKLKSGAGWVNLTSARSTGKPVLTANFADEQLLQTGGYTLFYADDSEYARMIAFDAHQRLRDVQLFRLQYTDETCIREELHRFDRMQVGVPFVVRMTFWGEMSAYGLSFTDESGARRHFAVSLSGRNGSVILEEYVP